MGISLNKPLSGAFHFVSSEVDEKRKLIKLILTNLRAEG
jgi:hypothetical protein